MLVSGGNGAESLLGAAYSAAREKRHSLGAGALCGGPSCSSLSRFLQGEPSTGEQSQEKASGRVSCNLLLGVTQ